MLIAFAFVLVLIVMTGCLSMHHPIFGKNPSGQRLENVQQSVHYQNGKFRNLIEKPGMTEGSNIIAEVYKTFFKSIPNREPIDPIPSVKTDLKTLDPQKDVLVWFGHSSIFIQLHGKKFLIDPVMSGKASPFASASK